MSILEGVDNKLLLSFFSTYSKLEYALKRSGYFKKNQTKAEPDWNKFLENNKSKFEKIKDDELQNAVEYLLANPPKTQKVKNKQLVFIDFSQGESKMEDVKDCIAITRNNLFHGGKYHSGSLEKPERNKDLLKSCIVVLKKFKELDREVGKTFDGK